ncbi:MAG: hypothetical protein EBZ77_10190 [Chitinophagia bacterium]|nr:hypothetical protein [Chitinophagia bacterium]
MNAIAGRIHELMTTKGLSITAFAHQLGYRSPEKISRLFRSDHANPSADMLADITNMFAEVNAEYLLTGKGTLLKQGINPLRDINVTAENYEYYGHNAYFSEAQNRKSVQTLSKIGYNQPEKYPVAPAVITVNENNEENILFIPVKARAGYLTGFADPEYIASLPAYRMPGLTNATYRMFEVEGPSMAPNIVSGDKVIGEAVDDLNSIRDNRVYIVVTAFGIVVKRLLNRIKERGKIVLKSDTIAHRHEFPTYEIDPADVRELWYCRLKLSSDFSEPAEIYHRVSDLESDMVGVQATLKKLLAQK